MLSIKNLTYYIGNRAIYEDGSFHIKPRDKVGLVGLNGSGKSTLLKIITGQIKPESGAIEVDKDCRIGFLNQDLLSYSSEDSILSVSMQSFAALQKMQDDIDGVLKLMQESYSDELLNKLTSLQEAFEVGGGYKMKAKAEMVLEGVGFSTADLGTPLNKFSGGWRMRVMLAKILLENPSILLLDEPTNHLDLVSIQWVEDYLKKFSGSVIVVSHDRYFLDSVTNRTVEVCNKKLMPYAGNYSFFEKEKGLREEIQEKEYYNQQKQIEATEKFIDRFRSKASKAAQVQSRIKSLDKIDRVEQVAKPNSSLKMKFPVIERSGRDVVTVKAVNKSFGYKVIFENACAKIERGDKIALIGANGKGKTTFLKILADALIGKIEGDITFGSNVISSFYAQHQLDALNADISILEELQGASPESPESEVRKICGMFLFVRDEVYKKIGVLSGGEKSRVALAKVLLQKANFLLLDEPTNHLDMVSVDILAKSLQQYEGTFVVISHDRHFLSLVANKIWYIEDKKVKEYLGTYEEYSYYLKNIKK